MVRTGAGFLPQGGSMVPDEVSPYGSPWVMQGCEVRPGQPMDTVTFRNSTREFALTAGRKTTAVRMTGRIVRSEGYPGTESGH